MKRIEIMAKMDEQNVAEEIIDFLIDHKFCIKTCLWCEGERMDAIYGLAQYLGEVKIVGVAKLVGVTK